MRLILFCQGLAILTCRRLTYAVLRGESWNSYIEDPHVIPWVLDSYSICVLRSPESNTQHQYQLLGLTVSQIACPVGKVYTSLSSAWVEVGARPWEIQRLPFAVMQLVEDPQRARHCFSLVILACQDENSVSMIILDIRLHPFAIHVSNDPSQMAIIAAMIWAVHPLFILDIHIQPQPLGAKRNNEPHPNCHDSLHGWVLCR